VDGTFDPTSPGLLGDGLGDPASAVPNAGAPGEGADRVTVTVDIDDVDEAPALERPINLEDLDPTTPPDTSNDKNSAPLEPTNSPFSRLPLTFQVEQQDDEGYIFLNLSDMIRDPEGDALDADQYGAAIAPGAPWLSFARVLNNDEGGMRTGPQLWEDIETAADSGAVRIGNADVGWLDTTGQDDATDPAPKDIVLILRVDRDPDDDGGSEAQDADAVLTVTATDGDNAGETTILVTIGDENTDAPNEEDDPPVVTLSGPPREGSTLTATFHEQRDPDFTGTEALDENPILVRYQWFTSVRLDTTPADGELDVDSDNMPTYSAPMLRQETTQNHEEMTGSADYTVRQSDVGGQIQGRVIYYELYDGEIVESDVDDSDTANTVEGFVSALTADVINTPDEETMSFEVSTHSVTTGGGAAAVTTQYLRIKPEYSPSRFVQDRDRPVNEEGDVVAVSNLTDDDPEVESTLANNTGYTFNYEWQYSPNGRTLWEVIRDADEDAVFANTGEEPQQRQLELPERVQEEGGYVRLVVIYEDEGDGRANQVENRVNRIESEAVKVGKIEHVAAGTDDSEGELHIDHSAGSIPAGRTLHVDNIVVPDDGKGSVKVEWQVGGSTLPVDAVSVARGLLPFRTVGEGREYTVSADDRGQIRAIVTRYDEDGGVVSITTVGGAVDGDGNVMPRDLAAQNERPTAAQDGPHVVDLGKAPDANGEYAMLPGMIDLQSLFTDPEGARLRFDIVLPSGSIFPADPGDRIEDIPRNTLDLYFDNNGGDEDEETPDDGPSVANGIRDNDNGDQLLLTDEGSGRIEYHTTKAQDHGMDMPTGTQIGTDGSGNWIPLTVRVSDNIFVAPTMNSPSVPIHLRIDAAPTGFHLSRDDSNVLVDGESPEPADNNAHTLLPLAEPDAGTGVAEGTETSAPVARADERPMLPTVPSFDYGSGDGRAFTYYPYTVREHTGDHVVTARDQDLAFKGMTAPTDGYTGTTRVIARIDVQDDNEASHAYGQYTFTVDDDRFEVVSVPTDASSGILRLKTEENLDFEALESPTRTLDTDGGSTSYVIDDDNRPIELVVTATPVDPDGSDPHDPITLGIVVNVINVDEPADPDANDVPGLEDDEDPDDGANTDAENAPADDTDTTDDGQDDEEDDDHDGGWWEVASLDDGLF